MDQWFEYSEARRKRKSEGWKAACLLGGFFALGYKVWSMLMDYDPINRFLFYKWLLAFEVIGGTMFVIGIVYLVSYWYYCLKVRRLERHNNFYFGE